MTAVAATFVDLRTVKTRSTMQLIFEIPIEQADDALAALGGVPRPSHEAWVGIARLSGKPQEALPAPAAIAPPKEPAALPAPRQRERKRFRDQARATQAALKCTDPEFQDWIIGEEDCPEEVHSREDWAAYLVRRECQVVSRADFDKDQAAGLRWDALLTRYDVQTGKMADPRF